MIKQLVSEETLITQRQEGMALVTPLKSKVVNLTITTAADYAQADSVLAEIRSRRAAWKAKNAKATEKLQEALKAQKAAVAAYKEVFDAIDGPLLAFETSVKESMRQFKLDEAKALQAAEEERVAEQNRLDTAIKAKQQAEDRAKTEQLRSRLAMQRAELEQKMATRKAAEPAAPVKATASVARKTKKYRVTDMLALVRHILASRKDLESLVALDEGQLTALFKLDDPKVGEVGAWLPGTEVYEDINIAGRG